MISFTPDDFLARTVDDEVILGSKVELLCWQYALAEMVVRQKQRTSRVDNRPTHVLHTMAGKMAEVCAWVLGYGTQYPDFGIRMNGSLSRAWDGDLGDGWHVKNCSRVMARTSLSWVAEKNDPATKTYHRGMHGTPVESYIVLMVGSTECIGVVRGSSVVGLWKPTQKLGPHKVALYWEDIKHLLLFRETAPRPVVTLHTSHVTDWCSTLDHLCNTDYNTRQEVEKLWKKYGNKPQPLTVEVTPNVQPLLGEPNA